MALQILKDNSGKDTGVYVPIEYWTLIKKNYPDIETIEQDLASWEKDIIDSRLDAIARNPERLRPIDELLQELNRKI